MANAMHEELTALASHSSGVVETSSFDFASVGKIELKDSNSS